MIEMQMENERVERLQMHQLGEDWIRAIANEALDRLEQFCQPESPAACSPPSSS